MTRAQWMLLILLIASILAGGCARGIRARRIAGASELDGHAPVGFLLTEKGGLLLQTDENLFDMDSDKSLLSESPGPVTASVMIGGTPAVLIGQVLYAVESGGARKLLEVPLENVVMAGGREFAYISGTTPAGRSVLFIYSLQKGNQPIIEVPQPLDAMAVSDERVYFAVGAGIFTFEPGQEVIAVAMLPGMRRIISLAVDPAAGVIYLSDGEATHAILSDRAKIVLLFRDAGGPLGRHAGNLYLLRRQDSTLYRIKGLSAALTSGSPPILELK